MASQPRFLTKRDIVAEAIRRDILKGVLLPGAQLQQDEIAARLGVSPTPVREAFGSLQAEGYLENIPHRGVFVSTPSYDDLIDTYELRAAVEGLALRRVAPKSADVARKLQKHAVRTEQELKTGNAERIRRSIIEFHKIIVDLAHSQMFAEVASKLVTRSNFFPPFDLVYMEQVHSEHMALVQMLQDGRVDDAVEFLSEHYRGHADRIRSLMHDAHITEPKSRLTA